MIKADIDGIFQTPIYRTQLTQDFSKKQLSFIDKMKLQSQNEQKTKNKSNNITSSNKNILDEPVFKKLKQEVELIIKDYFEKIISPSNNITPYITQSWLNYTEPGQFHHTHSHGNSLVSGVLYINCHETLDKIKFYSYRHDPIVPEVHTFNHFNSESWWFNVKTKEVILFPSSLSHGVDVKEGENTRISLAFNTFIKGNIGDYNSATELIL
jgi:uncharacterized protein (TIGR02466 family)